MGRQMDFEAPARVIVGTSTPSAGPASALETPAGVDAAVLRQKFFSGKPLFLLLRPYTDWARPTHNVESDGYLKSADSTCPPVLISSAKSPQPAWVRAGPELCGPVPSQMDTREGPAAGVDIAFEPRRDGDDLFCSEMTPPPGRGSR